MGKRATEAHLLALLADDGHVTIDLHWLLTSAIEFTNRSDSGALLVVLQDSALLHGRALLEFACLRSETSYFRLQDFIVEGAVPATKACPWKMWLAFMNSQTSHLARKRDPGAVWPHGLTYGSLERMNRLADDVVLVLEANVEQVRSGPLQNRFRELCESARDHLDRLDPPSRILC